MARRSESSWVPCPAGEFERLSRRLRLRRRRRAFLRAAAAAAVVGGGGLALWLGLGGAREPTRGGLTCTHVKGLAADYAAGRLSEDVRQQVREHLAWCAPCRAYYQAKGLTQAHPNPISRPPA